MARYVISNKIMREWAAAMVVEDIDTMRRMVIDFKVGEVPAIYIERFGDERLLKVTSTLDGIEIRRDPDLEAEQRAVDAYLAAGITADEAIEHVKDNPL